MKMRLDKPLTGVVGVALLSVLLLVAVTFIPGCQTEARDWLGTQSPSVQRDASQAADVSQAKDAPQTKDVVDAMAVPLTLITTIVGFFVIYRQLRGIEAQERMAARVARSQLYGEIRSATQEINEKLLQEPVLKHLFVEGGSLRDVQFNGATRSQRAVQARDMKLKLNSICEMFVDFADDLVEQYRSLPEDIDWSTWWAYLRDVYEQSPALRNYIWKSYNTYYPDYTLMPFGFVIARKNRPSGEIRGIWVPERTVQRTAVTCWQKCLVKIFRAGMKKRPGVSYPWLEPRVFYLMPPLKQEPGQGDQPLGIALCTVTATEERRRLRSVRVTANVCIVFKGDLGRSDKRTLCDWWVQTLAFTNVDTIRFTRDAKQFGERDLVKMKMTSDRRNRGNTFKVAAVRL